MVKKLVMGKSYCYCKKLVEDVLIEWFYTLILDFEF